MDNIVFIPDVALEHCSKDWTYRQDRNVSADLLLVVFE